MISGGVCGALHHNGHFLSTFLWGLREPCLGACVSGDRAWALQQARFEPARRRVAREKSDRRRAWSSSHGALVGQAHALRRSSPSRCPTSCRERADREVFFPWSWGGVPAATRDQEGSFPGHSRYPQVMGSLKFTQKQGQYLAFIHAYTKVNKRPPAEADFQRFFAVTPPTVHSMVLTLEREGLITRTPGVPRSIQLNISPLDLPVLE